MARTDKNALLSGVSGSIGNLVIKQYADKIVVSKKPDMSRVKTSELQQVYQGSFAEAVAYAQQINRDPVKKAAYAKKLKKGQTVFNAAISEYLKNWKKK